MQLRCKQSYITVGCCDKINQPTDSYSELTSYITAESPYIVINKDVYIFVAYGTHTIRQMRQR